MQRRLVRQLPKLGMKLPPWFERLLSAGIVSTDRDVVRRQRCVNVAAFAASADAASHLIFNMVYDFQGLLPLHLYNAAMVVLPLQIPRLHRLGENVGAVTLALLILVAHMFVVWAMGISSDLHVYYTLSGAFLLGIGVQHWRTFLVVFALWVGALLFAMNFAPFDGFISPEDRPIARHAVDAGDGQYRRDFRYRAILCPVGAAARRSRVAAPARTIGGADCRGHAAIDCRAVEVQG